VNASILSIWLWKKVFSWQLVGNAAKFLLVSHAMWKLNWQNVYKIVYVLRKIKYVNVNKGGMLITMVHVNSKRNPMKIAKKILNVRLKLVHKVGPNFQLSHSECILNIHIFVKICLGKCDCEPENVYDSQSDRCIPLLGADCRSREDCPANTICGLSEEPNFYDRETNETRKKCLCDSHHSRNTNGTCGLGYGRKCEKGGECGNMYLACFDGTCDCRYPLHQYYDEIFRACISYVSGPCTNKKEKQVHSSSYFFGPIQQCTEYAECVDRGFYSECVCADGYVEKGGRCFPGFQKYCNSLECQPPLYCVENKCQCHDGLQMYDKDTNSCRGLVGSTCQIDDTIISPCVPFASCTPLSAKKNRGVESSQNVVKGKCMCDKNATLVANRTCNLV